jgi:hypothetical protein
MTNGRFGVTAKAMEWAVVESRSFSSSKALLSTYAWLFSFIWLQRQETSMLESPTQENGSTHPARNVEPLDPVPSSASAETGVFSHGRL